MQIRLLDETDRAAATALLAGDPIGGGLIHGLIVRHGFRGTVEHWGMYQDMAMVGIMSPGSAGRCPVYGAGPEWSTMIAGLVRYWWQSGRRLDSVDVPADMAGPLAEALPPARLNELEIWACQECQATVSRPLSSPLLLREVTEDDIPELTGMYTREPAFGWVDVPGVMRMCRDGHRLWLAGEVKDEPVKPGAEEHGRHARIVTAGWGNTLEPGAARVSGVVTRPDSRGRGYATQLVGGLTAALLAEGRVPYLYVSTHEPAARAVYSKLGYRLHSRRAGLIYRGDH